MCRYEMDPMSIVEDTERTWFCPQTDKVKPVYHPFNLVEAGGITGVDRLSSTTQRKLRKEHVTNKCGGEKMECVGD